MRTSHSLRTNAHSPGAIALFGAVAIIVALCAPVSAHASAQATAHTARQRKSPRKVAITRELLIRAQQRLIDLGYWIGEPDGKWGEASRFGLIAFQKVEGRPRNGKLTSSDLAALEAASRPSPRERGAAHIEVDLTRQVLFVVDADGTVSKILPVSTGNGELFTVEGYTQPAVTPVGRFRVSRQLEGWRKSKLGLLYYPNYIVGGIAIHGNPAVPAKPASHGCIRIPMFAAQEFSQMAPVGTQVIVHGNGPAAASLTPPRSH